MAGVLAVSVAGCSLGMKTLEPNYDPRTIPRCDADASAPAGDALGAGVFGVLAILVATVGHGDGRAGGAIGTGVGAVILGASAYAGFGWASDCQKANKQWDARQIEQDAHLHGDKLPRAPTDPALLNDRERAIVESRAKRVEVGPKPAASPPPPSASFHCYASPVDGNSGFCARTLSACSEARAHDMATVTDLSACSPAPKAACFKYQTVLDAVSHEVCGPTLPTCNKRREAAVAIGPSVSISSDCTETD